MSPVPSTNGKQAATTADEEEVSPLGGVSPMSGSHYLGYPSQFSLITFHHNIS